MRPLLGALILAVSLVVIPAQLVLAQQPRDRDATPFERPKPVATIASPSNRETLTQLRDVLTPRGYTITSIEWDRGELSAVKKDSPTSDKSDRVLLWLERDPIKPLERASIYFLYGRFEPFFGSAGGPVRVRMTWPDELARMTAFQDSLVAFALSRP